MAGVTRLYRAVNNQPARADDFRSLGAEATAAGTPISTSNLRNRAYMEGVSVWSTMERMVFVNQKHLKRPHIAVLDVDVLRTGSVEAEHRPADGHHNLYGPPGPMIAACAGYTRGDGT
jgi:hypothetical protein